jgi:hypothetical protein
MEFFVPFIIVAGVAIFFFLVMYICCTKSEEPQSDQVQTNLSQQQQQPQPQLQHQHQQQQQPTTAVFSIYPIKPELDPPPSYESVISQSNLSDNP